MRVQRIVVWCFATMLSLGASWVVWRGPRPEPPPTEPSPLSRANTQQEEAQVKTLARRVIRELEATAARIGHAPPLLELEGVGPDGQPYLPSGLPDNPLVPGVAGVSAGCPNDAPPGARMDWRYCPAPLLFSAP
jgi:hypothetical protein